MSKRQELEIQMEEQLRLWFARLDAFTPTSTDETRVAYHRQLDEWRAQGLVAVARLAELKAISDDSWDAARVVLEKAWHDIEALLIDERDMAAANPVAGGIPATPATPPLMGPSRPRARSPRPCRGVRHERCTGEAKRMEITP